MLTELQTVILTCLLGPVDKTAWRRARAVDRVRKWREDTYTEENPRPYGDTERQGARRRYVKNQQKLRDYSRWFYRENKKSVIEAQRIRYNTLRREDPEFRLCENLRSRVRGALKRAIAKKGSKTFHLVGCSSGDLMVHLESLFKPGMSWGNYGPVWHVDHIRPCASFNLLDPEQQRACFHWTNLQPLFALENIKKGDKYAG